MKNNDGIIKGLITTDQHTVHPNTPTKHVLGNLTTCYYKDNSLKDLDLNLWNGDLYDRLVDAPNGDYYEVRNWFRRYFKDCFDSDVTVRLMEGTFSHDRGQQKDLQLLIPEGADIKYIDSIQVEIIDKLGISILYIPDNLGRMSNQAVYDKAVEEMAKVGLTKVDIIMFHGGFKYQLNMIKPNPGHDEQMWIDLTNYVIFGGHIHRRSKYGKIECVGSFDRVAHGEEHAKGGLLFQIDTINKTYKSKFYENKNALPYITVNILPTDDEVTIADKVNAIIDKKLIPYSNIRIKGGDGKVVAPIVSYFSSAYPLYRFTSDNVTVDGNLVKEELYTDATYSGVCLTKDNLSDALMDYLAEKILSSGISEIDLREELKSYL